MKAIFDSVKRGLDVSKENINPLWRDSKKNTFAMHFIKYRRMLPDKKYIHDASY